jgi:hypothetical protein
MTDTVTGERKEYAGEGFQRRRGHERIPGQPLIVLREGERGPSAPTVVSGSAPRSRALEACLSRLDTHLASGRLFGKPKDN